MWKTAIITGMLLLAATAMANTIQIGGTTVEYYLVTEPFYGRHYEPILTNGEGHIVFNMTLSKDFTITPNMMKTWKKWQIGNMTLKNTTIYVLSDINYTALIPNGTVEDCTPVNRTINNETGETQIFNICWNRTTYREEIISTLDWLPITTWTAKKDQTYYIDIKADFFVGMGKSSSDVEVNFSGFDLGFTTFNASMDHKMLDEIEYALGSPLTGFPYPINGSGGFNLGNPTGTQNVWALATTVNGTNYLYYDNNSVYQVANGSEASAVPFEVEKGNTTSYQNQTVWNSSTYRGVWHLSESGTTLYDSSAWGNNATKQGTVIYNTSGKIAAAYSQQGWASATNYIRITSSTSLNFTGSASWEAWIFMNNVTHFVNGGMAICKGNKNYAIGVFGDGDGTKTGKVFCRTSDGTTWDVTATSTTILNNYTWYHIGCSWTNAGGMILYINGARAASAAAGGRTIPQTNTPLYIMSGQGEPDWNGTVDEVRIMNVEMPPSYFNASYLSMAGTFSVLGTEEDTGEPPLTAFNLTIESPTNTTYYNESQPVNMSLNYTIDLNGKTLDKIWYNLNGTTGTSETTQETPFTDYTFNPITTNWTETNGTGWFTTTAVEGGVNCLGEYCMVNEAGNSVNVVAIKNSLNLTNYTDCIARIDYWIDTGIGAGEYMSIDVSTDNITWTKIKECTNGDSPTCDTSQWNYTNYNITSGTGLSNLFWIRAQAVNNDNTEEIAIGNVSISCTRTTQTSGNVTITGNTTFNTYYGWNNITVAMNATDGTYNQSTVFFTINQTGGAATCWTCYGTKANIPSGTKCQINSLSNLCGS